VQAVRDEILNIMHRNNIGEKRGTWMEDWHQKLHNNTTPDDVAICEAYIKFLESGGDNGAYWSMLSDAGTGTDPAFLLCDQAPCQAVACSGMWVFCSHRI
jgi:hypothetical protein